MRDFQADANAKPLDPALFLELARLAIDALEGRRREMPPTAECCVEDKPGLRLSDCSENQMGMTIARVCRERFPDEKAPRTSLSFHMRWHAVHRAREMGRLTGFVKETPDEVMVHRAVFEAAAACPLDPAGDLEFDHSFESRIRTHLAGGPDEYL